MVILMDDMERFEAEYDEEMAFISEFCDNCKHREEGDCEWCWGNGQYYEEDEDA